MLSYVCRLSKIKRNQLTKHRSSIRFYAKKEESNIQIVRNIGISAHIDSGKTTLTERILFYTGKINEIHEVKGKDGVGATMDSMDLEREKGITIKSAATNVSWKSNYINIIDTPGHVDFTIEVERSLRVLDGAILVLCGVAGVQSQTFTVDRQMRRYEVPRIIFINKLDRLGADPWKAMKGVKEKLGINCAPIQIPIGLSNNHRGIIDIIERKAWAFNGPRGEKVIEDDIPSNLMNSVEERRNALIEALVDADDVFAEKVLMGTEVSPQEIKEAIRRAVIARKFVPVCMGSAFKNKGVQLLLDAVIDYLPSPLERKIVAYDKNKNGEVVDLYPNPKLPIVALAFKLEESKYGQLTWIRMYQGTLKKGTTLTNTNVGERVKIPRLVKMHAAELEDINEIKGGDICAMYGVECATGETFADTSVNYQMTPMFVPDPVVSLGVSIKSKTQSHLLTKALKRFEREDPTFKVSVDQETQEMLISGMGELHLEIYIERLKREYGILCKVSAPKVAYRETVTKRVEFEYLHKKTIWRARSICKNNWIYGTIK
jgi:elongation factor G